MTKLNKNGFLSMALLCFAALGLAGCNTAGTNTANTTAGNGNTAVVTNSKPANTTGTTATPANTSATPANNTTASTGEKIGVPECDEYVEKYEACLTSIAEKYPQVQPQLKTAFEAQRKGFKDSAATPQGKAALGPACKQALETTKQATAAYACKW